MSLTAAQCHPLSRWASAASPSDRPVVQTVILRMSTVILDRSGHQVGAGPAPRQGGTQDHGRLGSRELGVWGLLHQLVPQLVP